MGQPPICADRDCLLDYTQKGAPPALASKKAMNQHLTVVAAYHESAHAVVSAALGLPLQDLGIHIDTIGGGITFNLHRRPGDPDNTPADAEERGRSVIAIKAGYIASLKIYPGCPPAVADDDRQEEIALLNEMYIGDDKTWLDADKMLGMESQRLVDKHWSAITAVATALLAKAVTPRTPVGLRKWKSPDTHERWMEGYEVDAILRKFQLNAIVRDESEGKYYAPDLRPGFHQ